MIFISRVSFTVSFSYTNSFEFSLKEDEGVVIWFFVFVFCFFIFVTTFLFWLNHCKRHSKVHAFPINTFKYTENWPNILWRSCSLFGHFSASYIKELNRRKKRFSNTAWKVSIFKVFLVCIFLHSCITEYFSVFTPIAGKYRPLFFTDPFHVVQGKN